jgi:RND family efflux transporter MFP subunit
VYQLFKGQNVSVSTDIYPNVVFNGNITNISPQGNAAHTYPVEITIPNCKSTPLKAGTYVNVAVDTKDGKSLMIPRDAIISSIKNPSVFVVKNDVVSLVPINTGRNYESYIEVVSGLIEGEQVIINGQINLTDGAKVSIVK